MNLIRRLMYLLVATVVFASCDTRDDYYYEHGKTPEVVVYSGDSVMDLGEDRFVRISLDMGDKKTLKFGFVNPYEGYLLNDIKVTNIVDSEYGSNLEALRPFIKNYDSSTGVYELDDSYAGLTVNPLNNQLYNLSFYRLAAYSSMTKRELTADLEVTYTITLTNAIGVKSEFYVYVEMKANKAPNPQIKVTDLTTEWEKLVEIEEGADPDGDEIVLYEYCFDGVTVGSAGYEYEFGDGDCPTRMCAYDGVYISTTLNGVRHAFQSSGVHTISVRCKDEHGYWSDWKKVNITLK